MLTRRAAITVGVSAFMLFVALRYTSYVQHQRQEEQRRRNATPPAREDGGTQIMPAGTYDSVARQEGMVGGEVLAGEGVSLG